MKSKDLQSNYTTIEQSKKLLELGLTADSADCYYDNAINPNIIPQKYFESFEEFANYQVNVLGHGICVPCWSVGQIIEIMNVCSLCGHVSIHRTDREVTQIEQLIEMLQNRINNKTIDFSKLELEY